MPVTECIFCGVNLRDLPERKAAEKSIDHAVPQWLQKKLGIKEEMVRQGEMDTKGTLTRYREHAVAGFATSGVCQEKCNGGWMNAMEGAVRSFLVDLIQNRRRLEDLSSTEKNALALWAVKTAYSFNYGSSASFRVPLEHLRQLAADPTSIPDGVGVCACIHPSPYVRTFDFGQAKSWVVNSAPGDRAKVADSYKLFLRLGQLLLLIAYWPSKEDCLVYQFGIHERLVLRHQAVAIDVGLDFFEAAVLDSSVKHLFIASLGVFPIDPVSLINKMDDTVFREAYGESILGGYETLAREALSARSAADVAYPLGPPRS